MISLSEAYALLRSGTPFGDVYQIVASYDQEGLKSIFARDERLPNLVKRNIPVSSNGETCDKCGSFRLIQAGSCKTCIDCGSSNGCS